MIKEKGIVRITRIQDSTTRMFLQVLVSTCELSSART